MIIRLAKKFAYHKENDTVSIKRDKPMVKRKKLYTSKRKNKESREQKTPMSMAQREQVYQLMTGLG